MLWDLILEAFWVPLGSFLWLWGVLGPGWNFDGFYGVPCATPEGEHGGGWWLTAGCRALTTSPQTPAG